MPEGARIAVTVLALAAGCSAAVRPGAADAGDAPPGASTPLGGSGAESGDDGGIAVDRGDGAVVESGGDAATIVEAGGEDAGVDPNLPPEPVIPPACTTLTGSRTSANGQLTDETNPDTARLQAAIDACAAGHSVRLTAAGGKDAFLSGPLVMAAGVTLWIDAGASLFASRNPRDYDVTSGACGTFANDSSAGCKPLISVAADNVGIAGEGVIEGRGGEPMIGGTTTWWDVSQGAKTAGKDQSNPTLIDVSGAKSFTLYEITLHDSPKFHAVIESEGFVAWGVTILTPARPTNSAGTALTASYARNTDGIDPSGASKGFIVYSAISDGDDQVAIKAGGRGASSDLVIAHDRFGAGHGMSIGSETNSGVSGVSVYDLAIDGTIGVMPASDRGGIRIKSDASRGGLVTNVTYRDVCVRGVTDVVVMNPRYSTASGTLIPEFNAITLQDVRVVAAAGVTPAVSLDGYDAAHLLGITLDNVVVDGITAANVTASFANVTLGPGAVNFVPAGTQVVVTKTGNGVSVPNSCAGKWAGL